MKSPGPTADHAAAVETCYEVRGYRDPIDPQLRHEAHVIYRRTRVSGMVTGATPTAARNKYPPSSVVPLPASDELAAELASQRSITAKLREVQEAMVKAEQQVQSQYAALVKQTTEAMKLREELKAERERTNEAVTRVPVTPTREPQKRTATEAKW